VATGIGAAQILPVCRALKKKGNKVIGIIGAKSKRVLMLESQMRVVCDEIFIATNDGSYERKGLASTILKELLNKYHVHGVYAIGSVEMMEAAAAMTLEKDIPLRVTLNTYMSNGLGLCGSCRVKVGGQVKLACIEGPEFDGHTVDFKDLNRRMIACEETRWGKQNHLISQKRPGFLTSVKSFLASKRK
jgi:ferredoxin--NADP+ reductase